ncbi:MAG: oligosaccharide flippase family protein [Colwellia sp.]|nr:oligosaccharide flippase family protein [Colwellia sp.]
MVTNYYRKLLTLMGSGIFSQLLPFFALPLYSRFFSPSDFQVYAVFISIGIVLLPFTTLRLEHTLINQSDLKTKSIAYNSFGLIIITSVLLAPFLLVTVHFLTNEGWSYLIFGMSFLYLSSIGLFSFFISYLARIGDFYTLSIIRFLKGLIEVSSTIAFALYLDSWISLLIGIVIGNLIACIFVIHKKNFKVRFKGILNILKRQRKVIFIDVPSSLLNSLSLQLPIILASYLATAEFSGLFAMSLRLISAPPALLFSSIGMLFRHEAMNSLKYKGDFKVPFIKTLLILMPISLTSFIVFYFMPEFVWVTVFGNNWSGIGEILAVLSFLVLVRTISLPLSYSFYLKGAVKQNLVFQGGMVLILLLSFYFGSGGSDFKLIKTYVFSMFSYYLLYIYFQYKLSV